MNEAAVNEMEDMSGVEEIADQKGGHTTIDGEEEGSEESSSNDDSDEYSTDSTERDSDESDKYDKQPSKKRKRAIRDAAGKYTCHCGKVYHSKEGFKSHERSHLEDEEARLPHECSKCSKQFSTRSILRRHKLTHLAKDDPRRNGLKCDKCGKELADKGTLARHKRLHLREAGKEFQHRCDECDNTFAQLSVLEKHRLTHLPIEDPRKIIFICDVCERIFLTKAGMMEHNRSHMTDEEAKLPYPCKVCGRRFARTSGLRTHEKTHLPDDQRREPCTICGKLLSFRSINRHIAKHRDPGHEKLKSRFKCDECGKYFKLRCNLRNHIYNIHKGTNANSLTAHNGTSTPDNKDTDNHERDRMPDSVKPTNGSMDNRDAEDDEDGSSSDTNDDSDNLSLGEESEDDE